MRLACPYQLSPTQNLLGNGMMASAKNQTAGGDPYFANVVLLCGNDNAADGSTTFVDQSGSAHTLTATGNIQYDTAQAPTGMTSSILGDGSGDYLATSASADWAFGTGDFTVEFMLRFTADQFAMTGWTSAADASCWVPLFFFDELYWQTQPGVTNLYNRSSVSIEDGGWHHVAVSRSGTSNRMFFDGTQQGATVSDSLDYDKQDMVILFAGQSGVQSLNGHVCCFRVTKGVARYTADFTPPTLPLPTS